MKHVAVTAHRGCSSEAPENTLAAIERAIALGADFVEVDVRLTADGVPVLLHDEDLMRTAGLRQRVEALKVAELQQADVGSWFSPEFADQHVPTLRKALELCRDRIRLNLELKSSSYTREPLVRKTREVISEQRTQSECVITSLDIETVRLAKQWMPEISCGPVLTKSPQAEVLGEGSFDLLSVDFRLIDGAIVRKVSEAGTQLHVWTVNEPADMRQMINLRVDSIITDRPRELIQLLKQET